MDCVITNGYEYLGTVNDFETVLKIVKDDVTKKEKENGMKLELKSVLSGVIYNTYGTIYNTYIYEYPTLCKEVYVVEIKRY